MSIADTRANISKFKLKMPLREESASTVLIPVCLLKGCVPNFIVFSLLSFESNQNTLPCIHRRNGPKNLHKLKITAKVIASSILPAFTPAQNKQPKKLKVKLANWVFQAFSFTSSKLSESFIFNIRFYLQLRTNERHER